MMDWDRLTKGELVHLIECDVELESLILVHLAANVRGQHSLHAKCYACESAARKLGLAVVDSTLTKLESLKLIRWMLQHLGFSDDSLKRALSLLSEYGKGSEHAKT